MYRIGTNSVFFFLESKTSEDETDGSEDMKNSPNSLKIHDNNENCHDSGFHGIESRLLRRIDDSDDTDSLGKQKSKFLNCSFQGLG